MVLVEPSLPHLDAYAAALRQGWSPSNVRDVTGEQLAAIAADPAGFVAQFTVRGGTVTLVDGRVVPALSRLVRWMWDGAFCGAINLRYVPGAEALPSHVLGHIGYAVVPWKRRRGFATAALRQMLPLAVVARLRHVDLIPAALIDDSSINKGGWYRAPGWPVAARITKTHAGGR